MKLQFNVSRDIIHPTFRHYAEHSSNSASFATGFLYKSRFVFTLQTDCVIIPRGDSCNGNKKPISSLFYCFFLFLFVFFLNDDLACMQISFASRGNSTIRKHNSNGVTRKQQDTSTRLETALHGSGRICKHDSKRQDM